MSEITFDERIERIESLFVKVYNDASKLRTEKELDAAVDQVFNELDDLENRITALENNLNMVEKTISTTNGL
jgi:archaellum component FlaC